MSVYFMFVKNSYRQRFIYKTNSYFTILSTFIGLSVMMSIWSTLYKGKDTIRGISFEDMTAFVVINMLVQALISTNIHNTIGSKVVDGSLSLDFIKPIEFKYYLFSNQFGENLFKLIFNTIPACLFIGLVWGFDIPLNANQFLLFGISIVSGMILFFQFNYLLGISVFWLESSFFVDWVSRSLLQIFAGTFVPLWFYPDFLYKICSVLPFMYISFQPISIYLGKVSTPGAMQIILIQWIWIAALYLIEKLLWRRAQKIINIHGG